MKNNVFSIVLSMIMAFLNCHALGQNNDSFRMENIGDTICLHRIVLDSIYYESALVYNTQNTRVSGLAVDAAIELFDYDSYVRLILVDEDSDTEYLVFDAYYPKNMIDTMFNIRQYAHETTSLFNIATSHLQIEVGNAVCAIENIYYSDKYNTKTPEQYYADKLLNKTIQDSIILECINHRLRQENKIWVAGNTSLLQMTYDQRKAILSKNENNEIPNLQGFEYYIGGVFDLQPYDLDNRERSSYVDDFDWRDRHGQNWTTVAKNQFSCNSCWAFAPISAAENVINLYFNRHLDYDLSEQELLSCSNAGDCQARGGFMPTAINYLLNNGVVSENCFPYVNSKVPCNNICSNPDEHIAFSNAPSVNTGMDNIKQAIINSGSICIKIDNIWHYMAICGFKLLKTGDVVYDGTGATLPNTSITIGPNSPYIGQNCWLFKNSWGTTWGDNGFGYVITRSDKLFQAYKLVNPISDTLSNQDIICEDQDGDGYYNWGIGPKPATCPNCPDEPDCNDSDPTLGPYDNQYGCVSFCDNGFINTPLYINGTTTWDTPRQINRDIEILDGATLNICNTTIWELSSDCSIIVHPEGRLILDGATITNPCGILWKGIQVWGDSTLHQQAVHGNYLQGYLELKNGATIENAVCAVALCHPGVSGTSGGIVFADSAFFVNNAKAVHALNYAYQFSNGGGEMAYNSSFRNCTFTLDNDYLGTETFEQHVDLYDISSLEFIGCHFSVDPEAKGVSPWRCAIQADDAGFTATALCEDPNSYMTPQSCPDEYLVRCSFTGFHNAVYAANTGRNARSFTVSDAVFTGNDRGIRAENTGLATIIRNSFALGCGEDCAFGVYAQNTANHCIEENDFAPATGFTGVTYGVGLFDCGGVNDVYRNDFEGLTCGNLAVGVNTAKTQGLPGTVTQGLTYTCNTDTSNTIDFCVLKNATGGGSIRTQQGSTSLPAGNTFDAGGYHFYNDGNDTVDYHYNGTATGQTPNTSKLFRVKRISTISTNPCLSHYSGGPVVKSPEEKAQLELDYRSAQEDIERLEDLYKRRLAAGADGDELAGLAAQIAQRAHDRSIAAGDIARSTLNDTLTDLRELRTWLRNMGDLASDRLAIASLVQTGDFDDAFALAQTLPGTYNLAGDGLADHSNHLRLLSLYRTLHLSGRDIRQMTGDERLTVEDIARAGYPYSGSLATALLECAGLRENDSPFCPELPKASDRGRGETGTEERETSGFKVTATPNPASSQVTVNYTLPEGSSRATLTVANTLGEKTTELGLEGNSGSMTVDLQKLPAGVYFFIVTDQNGRTSSGKVVKQ